MIKYIIPAIIIFLIVLFWEKITELAEKKFNIKLNYMAVSAAIVVIITVSYTHLTLPTIDPV